MRSSYKAAVPLLAAGIASWVAVTPVNADITDQIFTIHASNALGSADYVVRESDGHWQAPGEFMWQSNQPITMRNASGQPVATLSSGLLMVHEDPEVSLRFSVMAGNVDTDFTITSTLVSFGDMSALGRASAGMTVSDINGNGVMISPGAGGWMYSTQYNSTSTNPPPWDGTTFHDFFTTGPMMSGTPGGSATEAEEFPGSSNFSPLAGMVHNISSRFQFRLSANDIASGTSTFTVVPVPAPASLALLSLGTLIIGRRRR